MDATFNAAERRVFGCEPAAEEVTLYPLRVAAGKSCKESIGMPGISRYRNEGFGQGL
jgi:hypothetical protein